MNALYFHPSDASLCCLLVMHPRHPYALDFGTDPMNSIDHIIRIIAGSREQLRSEFERPIGFVRFMRLEKRFAELVGMPVDLVTKKALKPHIGKRILQEVRYV